MMQRDETQLLEPWLRYHGHLFGYRNLVVLDHGSIEPEVIAVLARYQSAGVTVRRVDPAPAELLKKGEHVTRVIRALDNRDRYDFAMPMDCDEFLAVFDSGGISSDRAAIHAAFDALIGQQQTQIVEMSLPNAVGRPGWFATGIEQKGFLPFRSVEYIDQGFAATRSRLAEGRRLTPFCHLHFRNKPLPVLLEHARRKLECRVDCTDLAALRAYNGVSHHLVPYFFMTQTDYEASTEARALVTAPDFVRLAASLGIDLLLFGGAISDSETTAMVKPVGRPAEMFRSAAYLEANPDVVNAGLDPLYHYLRYGWLEDRPLSPPTQGWQARAPQTQSVSPV